jgi:hypothetical protein
VKHSPRGDKLAYKPKQAVKSNFAPGMKSMFNSGKSEGDDDDARSKPSQVETPIGDTRSWAEKAGSVKAGSAGPSAPKAAMKSVFVSAGSEPGEDEPPASPSITEVKAGSSGPGSGAALKSAFVSAGSEPGEDESASPSISISVPASSPAPPAEAEGSHSMPPTSRSRKNRKRYFDVDNLLLEGEHSMAVGLLVPGG